MLIDALCRLVTFLVSSGWQVHARILGPNGSDKRGLKCLHTENSLLVHRGTLRIS